MHAYSDDLAALVRRRWNSAFEGESFFYLPVYQATDALPRQAVLRDLLSICYQASLLREEGRPVRFRLILADLQGLIRADPPLEGLELLPFVRSLELAPGELRRLAAAAPFERALIGAHVRPDSTFKIWGLVDSGEQWMRTLEGSRRAFQALPPSLVVSVTGPGNVSVAKGSLVVARLVAGHVTTPAPSVLEAAMRDPEVETINAPFLEAHARDRRRGEHWARVDGALISLIRRQVALRIISAMRQLHHGGTLLILPRATVCQRRRWRSMLNLKYTFAPGTPRRRLFRLLLQLLAVLAEDAGRRFGPRHRITWDDYLTSDDRAVHLADEEITEAVGFLARLSSVDGAVVMRQPLELLGFGAEISGRLRPVKQVARALDSSATRVEMESTLDVGTRHRSAYRLCHALPGTVAVVISQDGSMRIMKRTAHHVVYSEHLGTGALGP